MTRARWADEIEARARAYWTAERLAQLLGDKRPVISPRDGAVLLRALGLSRDDTSLPPAQVRKYFQINHMVALLGPALRELRARHAAIRVLDAGCGRSYLTLLLAWCARHVWNHPLEVIGIDRDAAVIAEARRRAELAQLADVTRFEVGDLAASAPLDRTALPFGSAAGRAPVPAVDRTALPFGSAAGRAPVPAGEVHAVVALHACDTATCDALALGIARGADLLAVAPCCQAELARAWAQLAGRDGAFAPIWRTPHLRREAAADVTDAMRVALLAAAGYDVSAMELVPHEHTRKNTLIVAVRRGVPGSRAAYEALRDATGGADIRLARATRLPPAC